MIRGLLPKPVRRPSAPYVQSISPRLLWQVQTDGWEAIGFEYISGRHADYAIGSADLATVSDVMRRLGQLVCPDLPGLKRAENRWRDYLNDPEDAVHLAGTVLLHTDWNPPTC
ncbi:MAG: hypothetical protein M3083_17345 [Actinomycetota bacterium]|nr:hypothetical protein [Actinomycetota bacterium]